MNDDDYSYVKDYYPIEDMDAYVRTGIFDRDMLIDYWVEEMLYPCELNENTRDELKIIFDYQLAEFEAEKAEWPDVTDCELLENVLEQLAVQGIVCSHHVGLYKTDGYGTASREFLSHPDKSSVVGYCYYTFDEMMRATEGDGLVISFGSIPDDDNEEDLHKIGLAVRKAFEAEGFKVDWYGNPELMLPMRAIVLEDFTWQQ